MVNTLDNKALKVAFDYAKSQTMLYSKSFYLSSSLLPKQKKWDTWALYGFCRYVDNIVDNPRQRSRQELEQEVSALEKELVIAYQRGESEHPVLKSFIHVALKNKIPIEYPLDLLKGVLMDVDQNRYETFQDLYTFCYRVAGVVGLMMTHILGYTSNHALCYAEQLGIAMQLTNILRDIQEDAKMNRIYLPQEELRQFGLTDDDFLTERMTDNMRKFIQFQVDRAHSYYNSANKGIRLLTGPTQFSIYSASRIYRGILNKIEDRNFNPFLGRVFVRQSKKLSILFKELLKTRLLMPTMNYFSSL